jgi:hypothetical protein
MNAHLARSLFAIVSILAASPPSSAATGALEEACVHLVQLASTDGIVIDPSYCGTPSGAAWAAGEPVIAELPRADVYASNSIGTTTRDHPAAAPLPSDQAIDTLAAQAEFAARTGWTP